jgi:hypothetical protein
VKKVRKATVTIFALALLAISFAVPTAAGAGSITLTPTAQAPGGIVSVTGSGFGATKAVGIGFGAATPITGEIVTLLVNGSTRDANFTFRPIKPGSISFHMVRDDGYEEWADDNGLGELWYYAGGFWATVNYASGSYHREGGITDITRWTFTASYTRYQYNLTSFSSITTTASGTFVANITVPAVANGNYNVTAIDSGGNMATTTLNVDSTIVPEVLPFGAVLLLSSLAVVAGSWHFRKRPRTIR